VRGLADIVQTARHIAGQRIIVSMILLGGCSSFLVGNAYNAQMPGFAADLGHGDPGVSYSMLLAADAAGALLAGVVLESRGLLAASAATAIMLAGLWCCALIGFSLATSYPLALALLFIAGFFELAFNAMAQTLVQLNAPLDMRGRVLGLFNMASLGLRAFSGITVGLVGSLIGVHWSLALAAAVMFAIACALLGLARRGGAGGMSGDAGRGPRTTCRVQ
jgi:MFS family permease